MALITFQNVSFAYEGNTAVSELNFEIDSGNYLCIIGENGSGKSTLIKGLLQLINPQQGNILVGDGLRLNEIGYLPQQTTVQRNFPASAYEIVLSGRLSARGILPFYSSKDKMLATENIKQLDIDSLRNKCYSDLSIGQQQRVLLARALCSTGKVLLLDEPTSGLDPVVTQDLYKFFATINKENGITIIMVSHDVKSVINYASHILHLNNTQLFFGTKENYLQSNIGKAFLGGEQND